MTEIVATLSHLARQSPHINQRSGVSVRLTVANLETLVANAARRALRTGESEVVPRVSDLDALASSTSGKVEIETLDDGRDGQIVEHLLRAAVLTVFKDRVDPEHFRPVSTPSRRVRWSTPARTSRPRLRAPCSSRFPPSAARSSWSAPKPRPPGRERGRAGPRGAPPVEAAQQGRGGRPGLLPRTDLIHARSPRFSYSRWDGTQTGFELDAYDILEEITDDLLYHGDLNAALRRMMQSGFEDRNGERMQGVREMLEKLRRRRKDQLDRHDLGGVYDDIAQELRDVVDMEREALDQLVEDARNSGDQRRQEVVEESAMGKQMELDMLPPDLAGQVRELSDYDFTSAEAQQRSTSCSISSASS
jgi:hypothetical protein